MYRRCLGLNWLLSVTCLVRTDPPRSLIQGFCISETDYEKRKSFKTLLNFLKNFVNH